MKKWLFLIAAIIIILIPASASAEYMTFFDVINDVKLLLGDSPDEAWTMTPEAAKTAASSLEGFSCQDAGDTVVCSKSHWSGEFQITLYFSEEKLAALKCELTGPTIQDLNYQPGTTNIYCSDDLINRLRLAGLIPAGTPRKQGINLFDGTETSAYGDVFEISENTLLQTGYNSKTADHPKFSMVLLSKAKSADYELPAAPVNVPEQSPSSPAEAANPAPELTAETEKLLGIWELTMWSRIMDDNSIMLLHKNIQGFVPLGFETARAMFYKDGTFVMIVGNSDGTGGETAGTWNTNDKGQIIVTLDQNIMVCFLHEEEGEKLLQITQDTDTYTYSYADKTPDLLTDEENSRLELTDTAPKSVMAKSAEEFKGQWIRSFTGKRGVDALIASPLLYNSISWLSIDDEWIILTTQAEGIFNGTGITYKFEGGTLTGRGARLQLCDNGWLAVSLDEDGHNEVTYYRNLDMEKRLAGEANQTPVLSGETDANVILTVAKPVVEAGEFAQIDVHAPGADRIRLYLQGTDSVRKEVEGDTLQLRFSSYYSSTHPSIYYAVPSYNGVWSSQTSNMESVTVVPSKILRFSCYNIVPDGEPFSINIYEMENVSTFDVRIHDAAGQQVFQENRQTGSGQVPALPAGMYTITVTCVGNESRTLTAPLEVSSNTESRKFNVYEEDIDLPEPEKNSDSESPSLNGTFSTNDEVVGSWHLYSYTPMINGQPDKDNMYMESDHNLKDSPLGVDSYELIFHEDGTVTRRETTGSTSAEFSGIWRRSSSKYTILFDNNEKSGPYYIASNGDLVLQTHDEGNTGTHLQFKFGGKISNEEAMSVMASALTDTLNAFNEYNFGMAYYNGESVEKDNAQAFYWWTQSAEHGNLNGQAMLGWAYANGIGTEQDFQKALTWWTKAAEQGEPNSQDRLGDIYYFGENGVEQDYAQALAWYQKAAEKNNTHAMVMLGELYRFGEGVEKDLKSSVSWYQKAADLGDALGQFAMGVSYNYGHGVEQDPEQAVSWYQKAAEQGNADAQKELGLAYLNGVGVAQDPAKAVELFTKAAEQNHIDAQFYLASTYAKGTGTEQDFDKAIYWYQKSADQGSTSALYDLGLIYYNGFGVDPDAAKTFSLWNSAAEKGHLNAQYGLGLLYEKGTGVEQDFEKARYWYLKAAEQGHADSQNNLGNMYMNGKGSEPDPEQAAYWYQMAADQGNAFAQCNLALEYHDGIGIEKDLEKAVYWMKKAAEQGLRNAQFHLAYYYSKGEGTAQDYDQAIYWYEKAAEQGDHRAMTNLGDIYFNYVTDYEKALYWTNLAVEAGNTTAMSNLGEAYAKGCGVEADMEQAKYWLQLAAEQEDEYALELLAEFFPEGE